MSTVERTAPAGRAGRCRLGGKARKSAKYGVFQQFQIGCVFAWSVIDDRRPSPAWADLGPPVVGKVDWPLEIDGESVFFQRVHFAQATQNSRQTSGVVELFH